MYKENVKCPLSRRIFREKSSLLRKQHENEGKVTSEQLIKLINIDLFGRCIEKKIDFKNDFKSDRRMETENDEGVEAYQKLEKGGFIVKLSNDEGIDDDETSYTKRKPSLLGVFWSKQHQMNIEQIYSFGKQLQK